MGAIGLPPCYACRAPGADHAGLTARARGQAQDARRTLAIDQLAIGRGRQMNARPSQRPSCSSPSSSCRAATAVACSNDINKRCTAAVAARGFCVILGPDVELEPSAISATASAAAASMIMKLFCHTCMTTSPRLEGTHLCELRACRPTGYSPLDILLNPRGLSVARPTTWTKNMTKQCHVSWSVQLASLFTYSLRSREPIGPERRVGSAGLTARARPEARPETRAANLPTSQTKCMHTGSSDQLTLLSLYDSPGETNSNGKPYARGLCSIEL